MTWRAIYFFFFEKKEFGRFFSRATVPDLCSSLPSVVFSLLSSVWVSLFQKSNTATAERHQQNPVFSRHHQIRTNQESKKARHQTESETKTILFSDTIKSDTEKGGGWKRWRTDSEWDQRKRKHDWGTSDGCYPGEAQIRDLWTVSRPGKQVTSNLTEIGQNQPTSVRSQQRWMSKVVSKFKDLPYTTSSPGNSAKLQQNDV